MPIDVDEQETERVSEQVMLLSEARGSKAATRSRRGAQPRPTVAGRREASIEVVFIDDSVEFYHRVIRAIHLSPGFRGVPKSGLWLAFHDSIFALFNELDIGTRSGDRVTLRASAWFDPTVFHGQVTGGNVEPEQQARLRETTVVGVLTPLDNFAGRSLNRLGLAEVADLSFTASPAATASQLGGLRWEIDSGDGTLTNSPGNNGKAVFTADETPGRVNLELQVASGKSAGRAVAHIKLDVVAPDDAVMEQIPGTGIQHAAGKCSVGFCGRIFLRPVDVSFRNIQWSEGDGVGIGTGYYAGLSGERHCRTNPCNNPFPVLGGNIATGSKVSVIDNAAQTNDPPFAPGIFLWPIQWQYRVGTSPWVPFTIAHQFVIADAAGRATISKKGSTPVSANAADPTNIVDCSKAVI
jgi:hypothetical protein